MKTPTFTLYVFSSLALASPALGADAITPTDAYLERQADYLDYCASGNGENVGGIYGQVCVLAVGRSDVNTNAFSDALEEINLREDTADFELNALLRMMALYRNSDLIPASIESEIEEAILNFKYWMDEPGPDTMCWWSENHQILFHTAELMAGQLYPNNIFTNSGMTGTEHIEHARPLVLNWLQRRGQFGFSEWHSNVYLNEDIPALLNLVDFAQDQTLATQAAMVLDLVAFDFANNYFDGTYATAHGRTYQGKLIDGNHDSIREAAYLLLGLGEYRSTGNFSASHLVTSTAYAPPAILEAIALNASSNHVNKQRDGIDIKDGPRWGIGYQDYDDVVFYWGMGAYAASRVVYNTFETVDYYDLWDDFFWGEVPFLQPLVGKHLLTPTALYLDELTRGSALESMSLYTWRTPDYQLSGAQNFKMGFYGAQQHMWRGTLDQDTWVFTTAPGGSEDDYAAGAWTGGWLPQGLFHENVAILRYQRDDYPLAENTYFVDYTHAFFPKTRMDEVIESGHWVFGRKGDSFVGLYSNNATHWSTIEETQTYELIADGKNNVWILELGSTSEQGSFQSFVAALENSDIVVSSDQIDYQSPSQGLMTASLDGTLKSAGQSIDVGPYKRWDNAYSTQDFGSLSTVIEYNNKRLTLDFETSQRSYQEGPAQ